LDGADLLDGADFFDLLDFLDFLDFFDGADLLDGADLPDEPFTCPAAFASLRLTIAGATYAVAASKPSLLSANLREIVRIIISVLDCHRWGASSNRGR
jgi:hypothetical protein